MGSARDAFKRQARIERAAIKPATNRPRGRIEPSSRLGVVTKVFSDYDGELVAVRYLKPGVDQLDVATWGVDGDGVFQPSSIDEWFDATEYCVYLTPGVQTRPGVPIDVEFNQCLRPTGRPHYNNAGSYEDGHPENRTCEPEESELLPDLGSSCGEPTWWQVITVGDPCFEESP